MSLSNGRRAGPPRLAGLHSGRNQCRHALYGLGFQFRSSVIGVVVADSTGGGGTAPRWRHDGKEVYFVDPEGKLMAAVVRASTSSFDTESPVPLFQTRMYNLPFKQQYAVSADGRFLINQVMEDVSAAPITLVLNWKPGSAR